MNNFPQSTNTVESKSDPNNTLPDLETLDIIAPPPSLVDIHINHNYEDQDDDEFVMSPLVIDYDVMLEEIVNIQRDQQELIVSLDNMILNDLDESGDEVFNGCLSPYLIDDEVTGGHSINWPYFRPFVDEVIGSLQELKEFHQRTNDLMRRIRLIAAIRSPIARNSHCQCKLSTEGVSLNDSGDASNYGTHMEHSAATDEDVTEGEETTEPITAVYIGDYFLDEMGDS